MNQNVHATRKSGKHKLLAILLACCLGIGMIPLTGVSAFADTPTAPTDTWSNHAASSFAGGTGTQEDPYQIATAEQLAKLAVDVNNDQRYVNTYFLLTSDLDLSAYRWNPIGTYKWEVGGNTINHMFSGNLDGNGKTITGLYVDNRTDKGAAGLFGYICDGTTNAQPAVQDLGIEDAVIYTTDEGLEQTSAGILAGQAMVNSGKTLEIARVSVSGTIYVEGSGANCAAGGLIGGISRGQITQCTAEVIIEGGSNIGGMVGMASGSSFEYCLALCDVSGRWGVGGFAGYATTSTWQDPDTKTSFKNCITVGTVTGNNWNLGGFIGVSEYADIQNCGAIVNVTSTVTGFDPKIGGFMGTNMEGTVNKCYAVGIVTGAHEDIPAAGFVGNVNGGTITDSLFDSTNNPSLSAEGTVAVAGVSTNLSGAATNVVLAGICENVIGEHSPADEWTTDLEPTCTEAGSKSHHCLLCDTKIDPTAISATGHHPVKTDAKAPTCVEAGNSEYWYCADCGKYFSSADCTTEITLASTVLPATGHVFSKDWTHDGENHWHQATCGDNLKSDVAAHTWDSGVVTLAPTTEKEGVRTYTCTVCGATKTEPIAKLTVPTPENPTPPTTPEIPATGSADHLPIVFLLMAASGSGWFLLRRYKERKKAQ